MVNLQPRAKHEPQVFLVKLSPRAKREANRDLGKPILSIEARGLMNLGQPLPLAKRKAEGIFVNLQPRAMQVAEKSWSITTKSEAIGLRDFVESICSS